jgi:hypothetical protein
MSFLKKLFPFLFKSESGSSESKPSSKTTSGTKSGSSKAANGTTEENGERSVTISAYGIIARARNARGLRKGSKVYVRSILDDGERLRVRGTAPNGNKVTITIPRRTLHEYQAEGVPDHVAKHYDKHSLFKEEHEARMKAEALGKH